MSVKRALLPHVPTGVMDQYRLRRELFRVRFGHQQGATPFQSSIDVMVDRSHARRWLLSTGDTYRVVDGSVPDGPFGAKVIIPEGAEIGDANRLLGWQGIEAVIIGDVEQPRWTDRTSGTLIEPKAIIVRPEVLEEVGGAPDGPSPLPGLLARLTDAGHRIGLVPTQKTDIDPERRDPIEGDAVVILAAVPLHDVGGGSRGAQIALELVRRGYHVTYVNRYPSYEAVELGLRFIHPRLEQVSFPRFDAEILSDRCANDGGLVIVEIPDPAYRPALTTLQLSGWNVVCDLIDDWSDPALGGDWYSEAFEQEIIAGADAVVASASDLVDRASSAGRDDAVLVPNAVNTAVFSGEAHERPSDLPDGPLIGYHGSLYGDWIDWDAIAAVANDDLSVTVVLIGEARNVPGGLPPNVVFLGLKAQGDLPAYLGAFDVGIVPFTISQTTHAVSPLKVYEYLASGVPVAAPPLRALDGLDGVYTDRDLIVAVTAARGAPRPDSVVALRDHSWGARLSVLFDATGRSLRELTGESVRVERRPVIHYRWRERYVRR